MEGLGSMKIKIKLDGANGLHFAFGHEAEGIIETLESAIRINKKYHENPNDITLTVGSQTQLLALQIYCQENNIELEVYDLDNKKFEDITAAHKHVNDEYINLDLFGLRS